jgi:MFS family permease
MLTRFKAFKNEYPSQFWLLFWGMLISTIGSSMIWPFLMIYISERLQLPLAVAASMMTINAIMGLLSSLITGPIADSLGRKWIMVISLALNAISYLMLSMATTLPVMALSMAVRGFATPLYQIGADSMMADLVPSEKRADAYSLLRMGHNVGIAIGPAIGGFVTAISYSIAFYSATVGLSFYSLLLVFFARETLAGATDSLSRRMPIRVATKKIFTSLVGYVQVFRDRPFIASVTAFLLQQVVASLIWVMMGVYAKTQYHVPETQYGFIATTNALMVVLFQLGVTKITKRFPPLRMMALGAFLYAFAIATVAFDRNFWGFWISMVIMTTGELIIVPTTTTFVANLAPADMRGRYMSLYSLTWGIASGTGPPVGGILSDVFGPATMWYAGAVVGMISTSLFLFQSRWKKKRDT